MIVADLNSGDTRILLVEASIGAVQEAEAVCGTGYQLRSAELSVGLSFPGCVIVSFTKLP